MDATQLSIHNSLQDAIMILKLALRKAIILKKRIRMHLGKDIVNKY